MIQVTFSSLFTKKLKKAKENSNQYINLKLNKEMMMVSKTGMNFQLILKIFAMGTIS